MIANKKLGLHLERWLVVTESEIYRNDWKFLVREIALGRVVAVFEVNSFVVDKETSLVLGSLLLHIT